MTAAAALVFAGTPAISLWPLDGLPAQGAQLFSPSPQPNGEAVSQCGGTSPLSNACVNGLGEDKCKVRICSPNVLGGLAYTGTITAQVWGKDRYGVDRYVAWSCSYIADGSAKVGGVIQGGCQPSTNAPYECNANPSTGETQCGNYLWAPFTLRGVATPPVQGTAPLGQWSAVVERA